MTTQRKPYVRTMTPTWWQKLGFYRFYMLREGTSVLAVWFSIVLLYGVFALKGGAELVEASSASYRTRWCC